jgi:hypothetical protein
MCRFNPISLSPMWRSVRSTNKTLVGASTCLQSLACWARGARYTRSVKKSSERQVFIGVFKRTPAYNVVDAAR